MEIFKADSPYNRFMTVIFNLVLLNILFLVCSLPIVTIGVSCTAMHTVMLRYAEGDDPYVFKTFFGAFRKNLKQGLIAGILFFIVGIALIIDVKIFSDWGLSGMATRIVAILVAILYLFAFIYIFPLIARYENSLNQHLMNALILSIRHFPKSLGIAAMYAGWILLGAYGPESLFKAWLIFTGIFAIALIAYLQDRVLYDIFCGNDEKGTGVQLPENSYN